MRPEPTAHGKSLLDPRTLAMTVFEPYPTGVYEERLYAQILACAKNLQDRYNAQVYKDMSMEQFIEVFKKDGGFDPFVLVARDSMTSYNDEELKKVKKACDNMISMHTKIIDNPNKYILVALFSYIKYDHGIVYGCLNDAMAPYLLHMNKGWSKRELEQSRKLTQKRAQILFRVLHSLSYDIKLNHGKIYLTRKQLNEILRPTQKQMEDFGQFRERVLDYTLKHIRENLPEYKNLCYTVKKNGTKIVGVTFMMNSSVTLPTSKKCDIYTPTRYSYEDLKSKALACWNEHAGGKCTPRNCHKCQFCYEIGGHALDPDKPFGWVFGGTGGVVQPKVRKKKALKTQAEPATEEILQPITIEENKKLSQEQRQKEENS